MFVFFYLFSLMNCASHRMNPHWLALTIGNSRLRWALFNHTHLQHTWETPHLSEAIAQQLIQTAFDFSACGLSPLKTLLPVWQTPPELWVTSVVPQQTALWQTYSQTKVIAADQIPLKAAYSTLGLDRALAVLGASEVYGSSVLVIDSGTALTFTGADRLTLVGGAILPGLQLQFRALNQATAALPLIQTETLPEHLPLRWSNDTIAAMQSGIVHTVLASIKSFVEDWQQTFPDSALVLTGGDCTILHRYLEQLHPALAEQIVVDPNLLFWGARAIKQMVSAKS